MAPFFGAVACRAQDSGRVDFAGTERTATSPALRVTILGDQGDPRIPPVREAIAHWNGEFARLGLHTRMDSGTVRSDPVGDDVLRAASGAVPSGGPAG